MPVFTSLTTPTDILPPPCRVQTVLDQEHERRRLVREERERDIWASKWKRTFRRTPRSRHPSRPSTTATSRDSTPYTDPRTGLRYQSKSMYDLIKNIVRSLSPGATMLPCRVPASQGTTSPPEASILSSS
ncbi:hypothetical protein OG21DRAFT_1494960, partial [Imleria badia]